MAQASALSTFLFLATVAGVGLLWVLGVWHAWHRSGRAAAVALAGFAGWLGLAYGIAATGFMQDFDSVPPRFMLVVAGFTGMTAVIGCSPIGTRLIDRVGVAWLVGYQAFRIPVELFLAQMYHDGVVPVQMTFEGRNFDILSGLLALVLVWRIRQRGAVSDNELLVWNVVGLGLLINIVSVAVLSAPTPFRVFTNEPANTFVAHPPWVWLPTVLVQAAWLGHLLVFRLLVRRRQAVAAG